MKLKSDSYLTHDPADNKLKNAVINQRYEHVIKNFSHEYYVMTFHMWSIGFIDLKNIELHTKIFLIGIL